MKGNRLSLKKIYHDPTIHAMQARVNFISSKSKRKWVNFENNLELTQPHHHSSPGSKHIPPQTEKPPASGKRPSHTKWKSMELHDFKTKRYQQCKKDSETISVR
jgi:hypothetical protein